MYHITVEVIENADGVRINAVRKRGNGESRLGKLYKPSDLERMVSPEAEIDLTAIGMIKELRAEN